jgi:transposase
MRSTLVKDLSRFKQRTKSLLYFHSIPYPPQFSKSSCHWSKNFLRWLKEDIQFCEESGRQTLDIILQAVEELRKLLLLITRHIKALSTKEKYAANVNLLKTVPGIGLITAMTLLTEIETIDRFKDTDHFAGYVGLIPIRSDSGEVKKDGEMTFRGQRKLKRCLVESSWVAARTDPALSLTYNKLVFRMEANKAIIRIARKLLNRIYRVLKNKTEYVKCVVK